MKRSGDSRRPRISDHGVELRRTPVLRTVGSATGADAAGKAAANVDRARDEVVLVTGAAGFIGSRLAEQLLRRGHKVIGIDHRSPKASAVAARNLAGLNDHSDFQLTVTDVCGPDLPPLLDGVSTVFHMAAATGVRQSWGRRFADYATSNVLGTQRLLEACTSAGVSRVVVASSSSVYGETDGHPSCEEDSTAPMSPYGVSKLAAERLALAYASRPRASLSVVALRYFTVYGPRQREDMAMAWMFRAARSGEPMRLYGDGSQRRSFTFIDDAVEATLQAAHLDCTTKVINVGGADCVALRDVRDVISAITARPIHVIDRDRHPGDVSITNADITRARELLGFSPRVGLAEGLERQWRWIRRDLAGSRSHLSTVGRGR